MVDFRKGVKLDPSQVVDRRMEQPLKGSHYAGGAAGEAAAGALLLRRRRMLQKVAQRRNRP